MRLVRLKLSDEVQDYGRVLCSQFVINDLDFILDLYAFAELKGNGLPTTERLNELVKGYAKLLKLPEIVVKVILSKRSQILKNFGGNPLFRFLLKRKAPASEICEKLLNFYQSIYNRKRQAQCVTCAFLSSCEFGQQYGSDVTSISVVVDPNFAKKAHAECPELPTLEFNQRLVESQQALNDLFTKQMAQVTKTPELAKVAKSAEESEKVQASAAQDEKLPPPIRKSATINDWEEADLGGAQISEGDGGGFDPEQAYSTRFKGPTSQAVIIDPTFVTKLSTANLVLFEIARKLSGKMAKAHKGKFAPTPTVTKNKQISRIKSASEVTKILPKQHALNDDDFDRRLANGTLVKSQSTQQEGKRKLLYVLIDTSDSMRSFITTQASFLKVVTRASLASIFTMVLCEHIKRERGIMFMRSFDGGHSKLYSAREPEEFDALSAHVAACSFDGWSTNISGVLTAALEDIEKSKDELASAECLLITDLGAAISPSDKVRIQNGFKKVTLSVLDVFSMDNVGPGGVSLSGRHSTEVATGRTLHEIADSYFRVDATASLDSIVSVVGKNSKLL